jgi:putative oxidoreductase
LKGVVLSRRIHWRGTGTNSAQKNEYPDICLLTLRVGLAAFMMFGHGADKLVSFGDKVAAFPDPLGFGATTSLILVVFAEFFCSLAIAFGFLTRLATIPPIITMLVAAFIIHAADPWANQELAFLYLLLYVTVLFAGPGRFSIDRMVFRANGET